MRWPPVFPGVSPCLAWLRLILIGATLLGMLASSPLWLTARAYPLLPVGSWFPVLEPPLDKGFFAVTLLSLLVALRFYRPAVIFFLAATLFLYCGDQNRGTPWLYMYGVMMLLTLVPAASALAACRFVLSAVYVWGGIHKCNAMFFQLVPAWFVAPASHWGVPAGLLRVLEWFVASAPGTEIFIGLALWVPRLRWLAIAAAAMVHLAAVLFLGPLGHNYNWVVWPWNLGLLALVVTLFPANPLPESFRELRRSRLALAVVALLWLLPVLSFFGRWDSYFSFALYSGNLATADVFVSAALRDRLPPEMRAHVHPLRQAYHRVLQGPLVFDHQTWAMETLGAAPLPEPRAFRVMYRYVSAFSTNASECKMIVAPRGGPPIFYQGETSQVLILPKAPKP